MRDIQQNMPAVLSVLLRVQRHLYTLNRVSGTSNALQWMSHKSSLSLICMWQVPLWRALVGKKRMKWNVAQQFTVAEIFAVIPQITFVSQCDALSVTGMLRHGF